jgi:hypothetical protein
MDCYRKLKELDEEVKTRHPEKYVLDGIVDIDGDGFDKAEKKILWILKEANMRNYPENYFDLSGHLREMDVRHPSFRTTWKLVLEISFAVMKRAQIWKNDVPEGEILQKEGFMKQLAVIEVKKLFGGGQSGQTDIDNYYEKDKDIILAQIDAIEPDFIINGSRVEKLFNDLKTGESKEIVHPFKVAKCKYKNGKDGIIINVLHPAFRYIKKGGELLKGEAAHEYYFELVRDCIKEIS